MRWDERSLQIAISLLYFVTAGSAASAINCSDVIARAATLDGVIKTQMETARVPGASIAIVADSEICYVKGYGSANIEKSIPVIAGTPFGISSLSKTFTSAAVVALIMEGKLTPETRVDQFFELRADRSIGGPAVTVGSLLTHTAGFDDLTIGIAARSPSEMVPLQKYLMEQMPPRVRPASEVTAYSNHGFALLGGIVEKVTGERFERYVQKTILAPAQMRRSSFEQPLPEPLEADRAIGYVWTGTGYRTVPRIYFNDYPASGMFTTAEDMASFLVFLFAEQAQNSSVDFGQIWKRMQEKTFANHKDLPGLTFGFSERDIASIRVLQQGGDWQDYSSSLIMIPEWKFGMFMAFNSSEGSSVSEKAIRLFLPEPSGPAAIRESNGSPDLSRFSGAYRYNRHSRRTLSKIGILVGAIPEIKVRQDSGALQAFRSTWMPSGELLFRNSSTSSHIAFREIRGTISHLFRQENPFGAYERIPWIESASFHRYLLVFLLVCFLIFPVFFFRKRRRTRISSQQLVAEKWLGIAMLADFLFIVALAIVFATADLWDFQYGTPGTIGALLYLSYALAALSLISAVFAIRAVLQLRPGWRLGLGYVSNLAILIAFILFLGYWQIFP